MVSWEKVSGLPVPRQPKLLAITLNVDNAVDSAGKMIIHRISNFWLALNWNALPVIA